MGARTEVIGSIDELSDMHPVRDAFHDIQGIFVGICVGDTDDLLFGLNDVIAHQVDQLVQRLFAAPFQAMLDDKAFLIAAQDRFDPQQVAGQRHAGVQAAGTGQIFEVVHGKDAVHAVGCFRQNIRDFRKRKAFLTEFIGVDRQNSLSQRGVQGIDQINLTFRIFLSQFLCGDSGGVVGAADIAAQRNIQDIFAFFEERLEIILKFSAVDQGSLDGGTGPDRVIVIPAHGALFLLGKARDKTGNFPAVHKIHKNQYMNAVFLHDISGKIGGRIY